ncbi:MAG: arginase family protein [Methanophagales archaeon]|nr:arginase family protein [Methanophagales archaeon]
MKFSGSLSEAEKEKASYEIVGVPFDGNAFKKGAREGPRAVRKASQRLETFLWHEKLELSDLLYYDRGDLDLSGFGGFGGLVSLEGLEGLDLRKKKVFIGGDHSVSFPLVKHFFERGEVERVIVLDAHTDFRDSYKSNKFSNACVVRRVAELVGLERVVEIGVRSSSEEEYALLKDNDKLRIYDAGTLRREGGRAREGEGGRAGEGEGGRSERGGREEATYLSIDIDVLDPSVAPGVENPEPCGFSLERLISVVRGVIKSEGVRVVAADVVEVNPRQDNPNGITSLNAARLVFEILAGYWERDSRY